MENFLTFKSTSAVDDDDKMRFWQMFDQQKAFNFISAGNIVRDPHNRQFLARHEQYLILRRTCVK